MSNLINKIEAKVEKVLSPHKETTTTTTTTTHHGGGAPEGTYGPHSSKVANAADPRVDSDADRHHAGGVGTGVGTTTHGTGAHTGLTGTHGSGGGLTGTHGTTGGLTSTSGCLTGTHGTGGGLTGTHGTTGGLTSTGGGLTGTHGTTGGGLTGNHGTTHHTGTQAGNHGLTGHTGTVGGISDSTNAAPHNSNLANTLDPRVDSDLSGSGNRQGVVTGGLMGAHGSHATPGSGTAQNTAGPHNSDMMNQLDPRVDADLDGSKTVGGNKTYH